MRKKVEAKNQFEQYIYQVSNTLDEPQLKDKFQEDEKKTINDAVSAARQWFSSNPEASFEEITAEKKKLEEVFNPIM